MQYENAATHILSYMYMLVLVAQTGFVGAMISNLAFVFRNIFSKRGMKGKSVSGMNYYACLSMLSLLILTPFAIAVEGPKMWIAGWDKALSQIGPHFVWYAPSLCFYCAFLFSVLLLNYPVVGHHLFLGS